MNLTLEEALTFSPSERGEEYPDVFNDDCGLDLEAITGYHIEKTWRRGKRKAILKLKTWRGISGGAIHYYGKILIDGVQFISDTKKNQSFNSSDINVGLLDWEYSLELKRVVTRPNKWHTYQEDSLTNCFDTVNDLKALATEIFRNRFTGDWVFYVEDWHDKRIKIELY